MSIHEAQKMPIAILQISIGSKHISTLLRGTVMSSTNIYCVYHITYFGDKLPAKSNSFISPSNYIGSTSLKQIESGYMGSVSSKKYKDIWTQELIEHPDSFHLEIISYHDTRKEATWKELQIQKLFNVVKNPLFVNMAYASVNGCHGMDKSGPTHHMKIREISDRIQSKRIKTLQTKYGVSHVSQIPSVREGKIGIATYRNILTNEIIRLNVSDPLVKESYIVGLTSETPAHNRGKSSTPETKLKQSMKKQGTVACLDLVSNQLTRVSLKEFHSGKGVRYFGIKSNFCTEWKKLQSISTHPIP